MNIKKALSVLALSSLSVTASAELVENVQITKIEAWASGVVLVKAGDVVSGGSTNCTVRDKYVLSASNSFLESMLLSAHMAKKAVTLHLSSTECIDGRVRINAISIN